METVQTLSQPEEYKKDIKSIETFAQFLDEFYDTEELLFFLNARFVVFNELERLPTPTSKSAQVHSIFVDFLFDLAEIGSTNNQDVHVLIANDIVHNASSCNTSAVTYNKQKNSRIVSFFTCIC